MKLIFTKIVFLLSCLSTEQDITDEVLPMIILLYLALFFVMLSGFKTLLIFRMRIGDSPRKFQSGKPDPPTGLSVPKNDITETSMKLLWKPGFHGVVEQTFQVYLNNKDKKIVRQSDTDGNDCSYKFENLKPETYYDINVKAVNYKGASETKHLRARTLGKLDPPTGLLVANNGITETSIEVLWKPGFDGGFEQTFQVYLDDKEVQLVRQSDTDGNICSYKFENLKPDTLYDIYVKAENIKGEAAKKTHHVHAKTLTQNF